MKTIQLLLLLLISPLVFHAQKSLTGLWVGSLSNDSNTVRKDQSYEIALTQYKQKVYGYTRSSFIVNDTLFYVVKRVKGQIDGDVCEIKDDEIISSNFRGRVDKGIKVTTTFRLNKLDSTWQLAGDWKTNKTKNFYSISGKVELKEETNLDNSKLFPHLEELKVADDVAFYNDAKKPSPPPTVAVIEKPKPVVPKKESPEEKKQESLAKKEQKKAEKQAEQARKEQEKKETAAIAKPAEEKTIPAPINPAPEKKPETVTVAPKPTTNPATAAAFVEERKTVASQVVNFVSDSLTLALYDNGEVDGDTVSVLLNGEIILAKQGLKTSAIRKTIYVDPATSEVTLLLYAENLGKYPPNTGLLIVHDGDNSYQVRFSADLKQNAAVIFRRKQK